MVRDEGIDGMAWWLLMRVNGFHFSISAPPQLPYVHDEHQQDINVEHYAPMIVISPPGTLLTIDAKSGYDSCRTPVEQWRTAPAPNRRWMQSPRIAACDVLQHRARYAAPTAPCVRRTMGVGSRKPVSAIGDVDPSREVGAESLREVR
jgi:hypothetical protein